MPTGLYWSDEEIPGSPEHAIELIESTKHRIQATQAESKRCEGRVAVSVILAVVVIFLAMSINYSSSSKGYYTGNYIPSTRSEGGNAPGGWERVGGTTALGSLLGLLSFGLGIWAFVEVGSQWGRGKDVERYRHLLEAYRTYLAGAGVAHVETAQVVAKLPLRIRSTPAPSKAAQAGGRPTVSGAGNSIALGPAHPGPLPGHNPAVAKSEREERGTEKSNVKRGQSEQPPVAEPKEKAVAIRPTPAPPKSERKEEGKPLYCASCGEPLLVADASFCLRCSKGIGEPVKTTELEWGEWR
jgi:hypothetical protein